MGELIKYELGQWERLKSLALDSVTSPHSKRAYESALNHFLAWYHSESRLPISKAVVNAYKTQLEEARLSVSTINVRLVVDLVGKHGRIRSVPMPAWAKIAIDEWSAASGIDTGPVFRPVNKGGRVTQGSLTGDCIRLALRKYSSELGLANLAPHDLRRTFARLAHWGKRSWNRSNYRSAIPRCKPPNATSG